MCCVNAHEDLDQRRGGILPGVQILGGGSRYPPGYRPGHNSGYRPGYNSGYRPGQIGYPGENGYHHGYPDGYGNHHGNHGGYDNHGHGNHGHHGHY